MYFRFTPAPFASDHIAPGGYTMSSYTKQYIKLAFAVIITFTTAYYAVHTHANASAPDEAAYEYIY